MTAQGASGITVSGVSRRFHDVVAIENATFHAPAGAVTALIGPNGSGKTTLLKILAGLLSVDNGSIRIDELDPLAQRRAVRLRVGWMPDVFDATQEMTVGGLLAFFASAYQMDRAEAADRIAGVLELTRLTELADVPARNLSRGQSQKLGLARAVLHAPAYLLLDEPDAGLDPDSRAELRGILRRFADTGGTVLLSTHDLDEMHDVVDGAVVIRDGVTTQWQGLSQSAKAPGWRAAALDRNRLIGVLTDRGIPFTEKGDAVELPQMEPHDAAGALRDLVLAEVPVVSFGPSGNALHSLYDRSAETIAS